MDTFGIQHSPPDKHVPSMFVQIDVQYLIDAQAPAATNATSVKGQIHTKCLTKHQQIVKKQQNPSKYSRPFDTCYFLVNKGPRAVVVPVTMYIYTYLHAIILHYERDDRLYIEH